MDYYYTQDNSAINNLNFSHQLYDDHHSQLEQLINDKENSINNTSSHTIDNDSVDKENNDSNNDNKIKYNNNNDNNGNDITNDDYLVPPELLELNAHEHDDFYLIDPFSNDYPIDESIHNVNNTLSINHREDSHGPLEYMDYFTTIPPTITSTSTSKVQGGGIDNRNSNKNHSNGKGDKEKERENFQIYQDLKMSTPSSTRNPTSKIAKRLTPNRSRSSGSLLFAKRKSRSSIVSLSSTSYSTDDDSVDDDLDDEILTKSSSSSISLPLPFLFPEYSLTNSKSNDTSPVMPTFKKTSSTNDITQTKLSCRLRRFSSFNGSTSPSNPFYRPLFNLKFGEASASTTSMNSFSTNNGTTSMNNDSANGAADVSKDASKVIDSPATTAIQCSSPLKGGKSSTLN